MDLYFFIIPAAILCIYMTIWALIAIIKKRADYADIAWGFGFTILAWSSLTISPPAGLSILINCLITVWSIRLTTHIYLRNRNRKEDFRYQNMRKSWGQAVNLRIFFQVFLLQGLILYVVALPVLWIHAHPQEIMASILWLPLSIWLFGFVCEALSDYQLYQFQKDPQNRGKLFTKGLWSYSRHPNYLGEILQWWAIWMVALPLPWGWLLIISPLLLTFLIIKVSGVAPLEEKLKSNPDFANYAKKTPKLIPLSLVIWFLYCIGWVAILWYGTRGYRVLPLVLWALFFVYQIFLFYKSDKKSFLICFPLVFYVLVMGCLQEMLLIYFHILAYPSSTGIFPPLWILSLYTLFALTLNSSLYFLNRNLPLTFILGGFGGLLSYLFGEKSNAVDLFGPNSYSIIFISWGIFLTLVISLNRALIQLREQYTDPNKLEKKLSVIFDTSCPTCLNEMTHLKDRIQTGKVHYGCPNSDQELKQITSAFSYQEAMQKIHAIDSEGKLYTGTQALSELYARTSYPMIAIILQAPFFSSLFRGIYKIWAFFRIRHLRR
jgi:steroid 5-alpha reductase family enzyme/predicted DCC family thiol-disulfide oxidoreductase YuxK